MTLWRDVVLAMRFWRSRLGLTSAAVGTLGLGIGAATALFSLVNAVLLRPLPYVDPGRLFQVLVSTRQGSALSNETSPLNFLDERAAARAFSDLGAYQPRMPVTVGMASSPERLIGARISATLLPTLGVTPAVGRGFSLAEDAPMADPAVVVVSHRLALRRFGRPEAAVGQTLTVDLRPVTVVGVMGPGFAFPSPETDVWLPFAQGYVDGGRGNFFVDVIGRLAPGRSEAAAAAELQTIALTLSRAYPEENLGRGLQLMALRDRQTEGVRRTVWLLFAAAGVVLLIACANVAGLMLVGATRRRQEMAVRRALGAGRSAVVRQLLVESAVLALGGALVGLMIALWTLRALVPFLPAGLPTVGGVTVDARALLFAVTVAAATSLFFGFAPVWHAASLEVTSVIRGAGRGTSARSRMRWVLVAVEIGLSVVLLMGASLLVRSLWRVLAVDPGFRVRSALTFDIRLPYAKYDRAGTAQFFTQALDRLSSLPGVLEAGATTVLPLRGEDNARYFTLEGRAGQEPKDYTLVAHRLVGGQYFSVLGVPLVAGRSFGPGDFASTAAPVVVINASFARAYFGDASPIGRRMKMGETASATAPWMTVVGVVGDVRHRSLESTSEPEMYRPFTQMVSFEVERKLTFILRTPAPDALVGQVRAALRGLDPDVPLAAVATLPELVDASLRDRRFTLGLVEAFAAVALVLTLVGLYGVASYNVETERRAIGVRLALGATRGQVATTVVRTAVGWTLVGLVAGVGAALGVGRLSTAWLFDVQPADPASVAAVALVVTGAALGACVLPAWRAAHVDPIDALRHD